MHPILKYGAVAMLFLGGLAALFPQAMAWVYAAAVAAFELWLLGRMGSVGKGPVPVAQPPYHFTTEEAELVGRFRFYFAYPALARGAASVLAAIGLSALVLSPWLVFRGLLVPGFLVGVNLLAVGALTKKLAPLMVLRIAASKGDRTALRMLELHEPVWDKIRAANETAG